MSARSISRMLLPAVACCALALVLAVQKYGNDALDTQTATSAPAGAAPASGEQDRGPAGLRRPQATANALVGTLTGPVGPAESGGHLPGFDIARIEPTGEAVIAGRAAPGATIELLRNGQLHDRAVADKSGQFVMVPPLLPPGSYDLTLRSKLDNKQARSQQSVAVAIQPIPTERPALTVMAPGKPELVDASNTVLPKSATATVSRGDSLWRLSRLTYGAGTGYAIIYKANRDQIRNPNLIHPGQTFFLPAR